MNKSQLNKNLLTDIILSTFFCAFIAPRLQKLFPSKSIGWMSDRDKITEAYNAVSDTLWVINASALCQKLNIKEPQFGLIKQNDADLWCDMYIRIADYVAGIAAWDPPNTNSLSKKIISLIEKVFSGNRYLGLFRVAFFVVDNKYFNVKISRVAINKATHQAARRSHKKAQSLRGLSRKIQFKRE